MGEVSVEIAGRSYRVGCEEGEEEHLRSLASLIDTEARKLARNTATVPEARLLVMAALMLADRLWETQKEVRALEQRLEGDGAAAPPALDEAALAERIAALAARIEAVADATRPN